jgi:hypothetical protein
MDTCFKLSVLNKANVRSKVGSKVRQKHNSLGFVFIAALTSLPFCWSRIKRVVPHFRTRHMAEAGDISTRYGLHGSGLNPGEGEIFPTRPDRPRGLHSLLFNGYPSYVPGVKRPGRGVTTHPYLAPRLKRG